MIISNEAATTLQVVCNDLDPTGKAGLAVHTGRWPEAAAVIKALPEGRDGQRRLQVRAILDALGRVESLLANLR